MKFCSFEYGNIRSYGVVRGEGEVTDLRGALGSGAPETLDRLVDALAAGTLSSQQIRAAADASAPLSTSAPSFSWLPPIGRPSKILGVAINNKAFAKLAYRQFEAPAFFLKPTSCLTGHQRPLLIKLDYGITHPEPELAVVIGRRAKDVPASKALDFVFGYTIINDITSPDLKQRDSVDMIVPPALAAAMGEIRWRQMLSEEHARHFYYTYHTLSKGCDNFGPIGPWIVTRDEIADPNNLKVDGYWEDTKVCEDSTANLTFSVQQIIEHASKYLTLEPGDIIHCGTAARVATPEKFPSLISCNVGKLGGSLSVQIEGIGRLFNPVQLG